MKDDEIRKAVRERYGKIAVEGRPAGSTSIASCCGPEEVTSATSCCAPQETASPTEYDSSRVGASSRAVGYSGEELGVVPDGANMGLGCGNPTALASLKEGEVVLDLGAGGGIDCFLAANAVGKNGSVIGVDMTPEMVERARENARKGGYENVEFRLGEIENLPAADNSVDVVISNCVINLVPSKRRVFKEAFRVLKPGGRMMISDIVLLKELPDFIKNSIEAYVGCLSGAIMRDEYIGAIRAAGFQEVRIIDEASFPIECMASDPTAKALIEILRIPPEELQNIASSVLSIKVCGVKPN